MLQSVMRAAKSLILQMPEEAGEVVHTGFPYEVWITTPTDGLEVGGQANNWLAGRKLQLNQDYIFSWKTVPGSRDHYRFAFSFSKHADLFKAHWQAYLVSHNN